MAYAIEKLNKLGELREKLNSRIIKTKQEYRELILLCKSEPFLKSEFKKPVKCSLCDSIYDCSCYSIDISANKTYTIG